MSAVVLSLMFAAGCGSDDDDSGTSSGGAAGTAGGAGSAGTGGSAGSGGFSDMAPKLGDPLPESAPGQWVWTEIAGAHCRDGSNTGFWLKRSATSKNLLIYLEGGGVCFTPGFCSLNAANVRERVYGEVFPPVAPESDPMNVRLEKSAEPFKPYTNGIFDTSKADNPVRDWNMVFIPYCTGDVHSGTRTDVVVPGDTSGKKQQFVGYLNMQKFIGRLAPTFKDASRVLLTGSSAGGFGAGLNYNQTQDAFLKVGSANVTALMDSAVIYDDKYLPACLQKQWRELWGLNASLPPDCADCQRADGSGFWRLIFYSSTKYPNAELGVISATRDSIMRLFLAQGENDCGKSPPLLLPADKYETALIDLRAQVAAAENGDRFGSYYIGSGSNPNGVPLDITHQWLWLDRFYEKLAGGTSPAAWVKDLLDGHARTVGP